ncbi:DNA cytosine methyltransferase [Escherichia coli]|nr:DNA cytosine methyltransferase [Escherichia coli]EJR1979053.1 DNA cytosine methyltransferase [Escherichia coli]
MKPIRVLSLFNGMSVGYMALKDAGIPVEKYYSSEIDKFAIAESQANFPDIIQLGDVTRWKEWDIEWDKIDLLMGGFPCFPAGTMIMTNKGHKDIKDIKIGDMVLTHTGQYQKVLSTCVKQAPTRIISGQGHLPIECTDNHPFYSRVLGKKWNNAKRQYDRIASDAEWVYASELTPNHLLCNVKSSYVRESSLRDEKFWYFMGRFAGDGWVSKVKRQKRKNSYVYKVLMCCAHDEFDELVECFDGLKMNYNYTKERTSYKFYITSKTLLEFCEKMGKGASNKIVHPELWSECVENKKAFLEGYISADGHYYDGKWHITSTSSNMILGIQQLVMDIYGRHVNIHKVTPSPTKIIEGRIVNQKPWYRIEFTENPLKHENAFYDDDTYAWVNGVKKSIPTNEIKDVYSFEVAVDNTYTANNIVVHNCQAWSVAGKQGGVNDPRGMLFHTMVDIYQHIKSLNPDLKVLFENVKMKEDFKQYINSVLEMTPVLINSQHYTPHFRQRYYWYSTDKLFIPPALSNAPKLQDIIEDGWYTDRTASYCIDANYFKGGDCNQYFNKSRRQIVFKEPDIDRDFLLEHGKRNVDYRHLTVQECCMLQGIDVNYFKVSSSTQAYKMLGNGWTMPVISHLLRDIFF